MQFVGLLIVLAGIYLIDSGIRNRPPVEFLKAIIADPSDLSGTIDRMNGTWGDPFGEAALPTGAEKQATAQSTGATNSGIVDEMKAAGYENGKLPASQLVVATGQTVGAQRIHTQIASNYARLNDAYKERFGTNIVLTSGYRSYAAQVATKAAKGYLAATPGTSNHGWGLALDLGGGVNQFGTEQHKWMDANAPEYGFAQPDWARQGGRKPEPWHYEYAGFGSGGGSKRTDDGRSVGGEF